MLLRSSKQLISDSPNVYNEKLNINCLHIVSAGKEQIKKFSFADPTFIFSVLQRTAVI